MHKCMSLLGIVKSDGETRQTHIGCHESLQVLGSPYIDGDSDTFEKRYKQSFCNCKSRP